MQRSHKRSHHHPDPSLTASPTRDARGAPTPRVPVQSQASSMYWSSAFGDVLSNSSTQSALAHSPVSRADPSSVSHVHGTQHSAPSASISSPSATPLGNGRSIRRKKSSGSVNVPVTNVHTPSVDEVEMETYERPSHMMSPLITLTSHVPHRSRKEKGKAVERSGLHHTALGPTYIESVREREPMDRFNFSGPLALAEYDRMKKENEVLRKSLQETKKTARKQVKRIDELKEELHAAQTAQTELQTLKVTSQKNEELLTSIEASFQCQICMDVVYKPYALSPCGHILCMSCLQSWFRQAPSAATEVDDVNDLYLLRTKKSCPCCRAQIHRRPIPVFMVKAVASALSKARGPADLVRPETPPGAADEDPWTGIFYTDSEGSSEGGDEEDDDDIDDDEDLRLGWRLEHSDEDAEFHSVSESDDGRDEEEDDDRMSTTSDERDYTHPPWEEPACQEIMHPILNVRAMLQRGCTMEMIARYAMDYQDHDGLTANLSPAESSGINRLYLGYNIQLEDDDKDGQRFVEVMLEEIERHPHRWKQVDFGPIVGYMRMMRIDEITRDGYETSDDARYTGWRELYML